MLATLRCIKQNYMALFNDSALGNSSGSPNSPTSALRLEYLKHFSASMYRKRLNP